MTPRAVIAAAMALAATLPQVTHEEARARGLLPMFPDRPPPPDFPKPSPPMAYLGKHAGRLRANRRLWRA